MSKPRPSVQLLLTSIFVFLLFAFPALADSKARVVRVSDVQGSVEIDRNNGRGYEKAFMNLPITEGMKIRTADDGRAELQFEDNSTLRLVPDSQIEVPKLSLRDSGAKVSTIHLLEGMVYVNFQGTKGDEFTLTFARESIALTQPAHLRIGLGDADAAVAVFGGEVQVTGPGGTVNLAKNQTGRFDLVEDSYKLAKHVEGDPFDAWDKQQNQYQQRYADASYSSYSPYAYGSSDLNYYGSWYDLPGYGQMWQPYFAGAGWDPFMNGSWTMFPGFGYGWVSAYPWGWLPYNYGAWNYVPLYGWMWQPGGAWMGGYPLPVFAGLPPGYAAPRPPIFPGPRVIHVNGGAGSKVTQGLFTRIEIPNNSAGLGIPRGSINNLPHVAGLAETHASVSSGLHLPEVMSTPGFYRSGFGAPRGSAWGAHGYSSRTRSSSWGSRGFGSSGSMSSAHSVGGGGHVGGGAVGGHH